MSSNPNAFDRFRYVKPGTARETKAEDGKARNTTPAAGPSSSSAPPRKRPRLDEDVEDVSMGSERDERDERDVFIPDDDDEEPDEAVVPMDEELSILSAVGPEQWSDFVRPTAWKPTGDLSFQLLECEDASRDKGPMASPAGDGSPLMRLFGITEDGHSVTAYVNGFHPFLLYPVTRKFDVANGGLFEGLEHNQRYRSEITLNHPQTDPSSSELSRKQKARSPFILSRNSSGTH
jgi:hypothetical protein